MDLAVQKRARSEHHRAAFEADTHLGDGAGHSVTHHHQVVHRLLKQPQVRLVFQTAANRGFVQNPIRLGPCRPHRRAFARIKNTKLDAAFVRGQRHRTAHGINLFDQVPFANAAD